MHLIDEASNLAPLISEILRLKSLHGVTLLAHYYQPIVVHRIADFIGDSLDLARIARDRITTPLILFAGVRFMAETAVLLNPQKRVLMVDPSAGCPLADCLDPDQISSYRKLHPRIPVVVYINSTTETKAAADVCCTSANAVSICEKIARQWGVSTVLFGPDHHLAAYVQNHTSLAIIPIPEAGSCPVHHQFSQNDVDMVRRDHPDASLIVHPESPLVVQQAADYIGSTTRMIEFVRTHPKIHKFIIGTELGLVEYLRVAFPQQQFIPLFAHAICTEMKKTSLTLLRSTLLSIGTPDQYSHEINISPQILPRALQSIEAMLRLS